MDYKDSKDFTKKVFGDIEFDVESHQYTVYGIPYTSVTSFIHDYFPHFDQDEQSKAYSLRLKAKGIDKTPEEILKEWDEKRDYGTMVHDALELELSSPNVLPLETQHTDRLVKDGLSIIRGLKHLEDVKFIYPEVKVFSEKYGIAGTIDVVMIKEDGSIILADWKTSNSIYQGHSPHDTHELTSHLDNTNYNKYSIQLSTYAYLLEEAGFSVEKVYLIHLKPFDVYPSVTIYQPPLHYQLVKQLLEDFKNE